MAIKNRLVELFENRKGEYVSGEAIAKELGVTRTAVWKAVRSLQDDGYPITAVPNKGYMLSGDTDVISSAGICKYLGGLSPLPDIEVYRTVTSTNSILRQKAEVGAGEGTVVVASEQTAGRGRLGRSFFSPADTGLYISVLLRPALPAERSTLITTAAAVAVCDAIEAVSNARPGIKWVNDVFIDGRKVCGILTEASFHMESGRLEYAVLGVGINVYEPENGFPDDIRDIAGSLFPKRIPDARNRLAAEFLRRFMGIYENLDTAAFVDEYRRHSLAIGRQVTVISARGSRPAEAIDVDEECRLIVRYRDGQTDVLSSGEISIKL